ncbi:hypothetical protein [Sciscionella marina]|uniref:hypothetical protein n=1 Tax=Sciscionella marina TaxID=508770 RepID=UPI000376BB13|nr:hypothetical protein [Sciscionella marina]
MRTNLRRGIASSVIALGLLAGAGVPALAATGGGTGDGGDPAIVDEPDTSGLHDIWTDYTVLGVPVVGLIQSVAEVPGKLLPSGN